MKKRIIFILINVFLSINVFAQYYYYVSPANEKAKPNMKIKGMSKNNSINRMFKQFGVETYKQSFPGAKNIELQNIYEIHLNKNYPQTEIDLFEKLLNNSGEFNAIYRSDYYELATCDDPIPINDSWIANNQINNDALNLLNAQCAWTITKGSPNVVVGVIDTEFEATHEDMRNTFIDVIGLQTHPHEHGTSVSSCVSTGTNNNKGIAGIGYNVKVKGYCADGDNLWSKIWQAYQDGIKIINVSWSGIGSYPNLLAVKEMVANGVVLVVAAGNSTNSTNHSAYADVPGVINVSGVWSNNTHAGTGHAQNQWVDVCALSKNVAACIPGNTYSTVNGTSFAAPQVAGVVALLRSINENFTPEEIENIIKSSAAVIDDGHLFSGQLGSGRVDAYAAVRMAKALVSPADLYIRDTISDVGNTNSGVLRAWASPDIWIEDMDGNKVDPSEDKDYNICVRIHNKSDYPSSINDTLILNWTKAGVDLWWNRSWLGQEPLRCGESDIILGGFYYIKSGYIGNMEGIAVPDIPPHSSKVFKVKWHFPKPGYYSECFKDEQLWHYCLLARVHDGNPIWKEDESNMSVSEFVKNNENVAWRNITFLQGKLNKSTVSVGNPFKEPRTFSLSYSLRYNELGELLNKYADVYLNMSSNLFELWQKSDFAGKGFKVVDKNKILLTEPTATIERLVLQPEELYLLEAEVNFFTQENPESNEFMFDIAEYIDNEKEGKELIGGETYIAIRNSERDSYFKAKALDDKTVLPAEPVSFRAEPISEDAVYTWFDQKGDTVARGLNLTVTPTSTQHYKLEVVATADGFKDYDSVRATVRNGAIVSLSPNPTDNQLTITYRLAAGITNATIEISDVQNLSVQSYPVTATATTKTVSLAGLTAGTYVVKLIVNGETVDTRQVIKN